MPTKRDNPKVTYADGGATTYYENPRVAEDLRKKGVKAEAGKRSSTLTKAQRMERSRQYTSKQRGRSSSPKRTTTAAGSGGNAFTPQQPAARPMGQYGPVQGPMTQGGQMPRSAPQPGAIGPYTQPQYPSSFASPSRPSVFQQPGVQATIQGMQQQPLTGQPYIDQFMQEQSPYYVPPRFNPWGRGW